MQMEKDKKANKEKGRIDNMMQTGIVIKFRRQMANGWACDVSRGWRCPSRKRWSISGRGGGLSQKVFFSMSL